MDTLKGHKSAVQRKYMSSEIDPRETEWAVSISRRTVLRAVNLPNAVRPLSKYVKKVLCVMNLVRVSHQFHSITSQPQLSYPRLFFSQFRYLSVSRSSLGRVHLKCKYSTPAVWSGESSDFFERGKRYLTHVHYGKMALWWLQGHNIVETFGKLPAQLWKCKRSLEKRARAHVFVCVCVCTGRLRILQ